MYKLLMRAFPGFHRANSVYALFPFTTPEKNREIFTKQGHADDYSYDLPSFIGAPIPVITWQGVVDVLNDQEKFKVPCEFSKYPVFKGNMGDLSTIRGKAHVSAHTPRLYAERRLSCKWPATRIC